MNKITFYIKRLYTTKPSHILYKINKKFYYKLKDIIKKIKDTKYSTHINFDVPIIKKSYINIKELDLSEIDIKVAKYLSKMYCEHRFDLLGSGWVKNSYDSIPLGVEGYKYDMNIYPSKIIAENYNPIDWQKDFKSGYRWSEKVWYKDQRKFFAPGADIKVPWELSRMQHLVQLAMFCLVDTSLKEKNLNEFKYQVLDFIENNPPRFGVNWSCTMDVAIRAVNMLLAYDLFCQIDEFNLLDNDFKQRFSNSIYEHGLHIVNNLEYSDSLTSNHYLANIAGLLFIASYSDGLEEIDLWLVFSIQELINEVRKQFYEDGGNFESSTSYHRLSAEMVIYSTALVLGLDEKKVAKIKDYNNKKWKYYPKLKPLKEQDFYLLDNKIRFPQWYIDKLYRIGRFTKDITMPN
ncbi:MAG: heparinase II/III family protein, partial [candidate division WOR-3 bacterium]